MKRTCFTCFPSFSSLSLSLTAEPVISTGDETGDVLSPAAVVVELTLDEVAGEVVVAEDEVVTAAED